MEEMKEITDEKERLDVLERLGVDAREILFTLLGCVRCRQSGCSKDRVCKKYYFGLKVIEETVARGCVKPDEIKTTMVSRMEKLNVSDLQQCQ